MGGGEIVKKIGNTQSGALLVEMTDAEYEKLTAGAAVPVDVFRMTMGVAYFLVACKRPWASR